MHQQCSSGIVNVSDTLTFKLFIQWLTELQMTAYLAEAAQLSARRKLSSKVQSTMKSTLIFAKAAVSALTLAQWEQS